jgi:uncharacterized protein YbjT (DUF2867 family)
MDPILVTGATGRQGGSVVDALLADGRSVRALTRDASSDRARRLADRGVDVVEGDLARRRDLRRAMAGVDGVFLVTNYFEAGRAGEIRQGRNGVRAAAEAGVEHVVFSSVASADHAPGVEHFRTKHAIESYLRRMLPSATIVRPTYFMSNLESQRAAVADGTVALPLGRYTRLSLVDPRDIGRVVAAVFADPDRFAGRTLDLAGDDLTLAELAGAFARVLGHPVAPDYVRREAARERMGADTVAMFEWFDRVGYDVDIAALEAATNVEMTRFESYLAREWTDADAGSAVSESESAA